jgi:hypothetical protein
MTKALFITEQDLIANSIINENVSYTQLRPTIVKVQEMRIQSIIGSDLYKEIANQIVSGTVTALNQTLLYDYLQPAIREWIYFELPHVLAFKYMNKGMVRRRSEESDAMSMEEIERLINKAKNDAEWYSERITRYLIEYRTDYPLFNNPSVKVDTIRPRRDNYNTGLNLSNPYRIPRSFQERYQGDNPFCNDCV